jgi:signal transduction histidine kinase
MTIMRGEGERQGGTLTLSIDRVSLDQNLPGKISEIKAGDYFLITVADTGIGIKPDLISQIFDPFFTTKGKKQGTGLGLSMVFSILETHHSYLDLYSKFGEGATFMIYLPVSAKY